MGQHLAAYTPLWAAAPELAEVERRFGTTIEYPSFGKGSDALTAVLGGSAEICNCLFPTGLRAAAQGQKLTYTANFFIGPGTVLVAAARHEAQRGTDLARFDGAAFGYSSEGGSDQRSLAAAIDHAGLDWSRQNGIAVGSIAGYLPALESGRVDLAMMDATSAAQAVRDGVGYVVLNTNDYDAFAPVGGAVPGSGLLFSDAFRDAHPELAQEIVTAVVAGLNRVRAEQDADAVYDVLPPEFHAANPDRDAFRAQWALIRPSFEAADGTIGAETLRDATARTFTDGAPPATDTEGFVDNEPVERAYADLGIPRPDAASRS
ncbi:MULTISPECIES: ABC transporter substrate-binding protein [Pseudonocardia]|uniref:ABC-type nitrate/sulfonate/bicarbonate transport system substrate-binding protein n=1 Tax=Pseudonocardia saturnea TaxID=33909 RepID=A0ABQ0RVB3_9PSEU|nr:MULTISPECIES: ABC transporter substrate-binding protein [Pseudonocardia]BBG02561.1 hypothetical protein Pdca_37700 [Pseudonocardia autotrophica]GEC24620.1 hypothetical protein PSA01_16490 [Pseudonocardia saturnea]